MQLWRSAVRYTIVDIRRLKIESLFEAVLLTCVKPAGLMCCHLKCCVVVVKFSC